MCVDSKPYIPCIGSLCAACKPLHSLRRGRPDLLVCARAALSLALFSASSPEGAPLPRFCMLTLRPCAAFRKHDLPWEKCGCVASEPYIPCIWFFVCCLRTSTLLCAVALLICLYARVLLCLLFYFFYGRSCLQRKRKAATQAWVLPCHRLPCRPSSSEGALSPRFCMLALRPCAVFCKHDLPSK